MHLFPLTDLLSRCRKRRAEILFVGAYTGEEALRAAKISKSRDVSRVSFVFSIAEGSCSAVKFSPQNPRPFSTAPLPYAKLTRK